MIILGEPKNPELYLSIDADRGKLLHELGFIPIYKSTKNGNLYFIKTDEILKVVEEKWNFKTE